MTLLWAQNKVYLTNLLHEIHNNRTGSNSG